MTTPSVCALAPAGSLTSEGVANRATPAVFSKSYCPYCKASKSLLSELGVKPYIIELDQVGTCISQAISILLAASSDDSF